MEISWYRLFRQFATNYVFIIISTEMSFKGTQTFLKNFSLHKTSDQNDIYVLFLQIFMVLLAEKWFRSEICNRENMKRLLKRAALFPLRVKMALSKISNVLLILGATECLSPSSANTLRIYSICELSYFCEDCIESFIGLELNGFGCIQCDFEGEGYFNR